MDPKDYIIFSKTIDQREANFERFPDAMLLEVKEFLLSNGITKLYSHQVEMFESATKRQNMVITTSTASGKTLSFLLPVLQEILKNPNTRAIFIYPTKALANDQYRAILPVLEYFGKNKISAGIYDGDTPVNERSRIRNSANIILTNPEMLNMAFLPNHHSYGNNFIFSNLKYVVIDELHSYRGAFGSHLSNVFKRLSRITAYYNSSPQFMCSSATIANPVELAEKICGGTFRLIDKDGSPSSKKEIHLLQPPRIKGTNYRVSVTKVAANLIPRLTYEKHHFIAFCKSRKAVEIMLKESRDKLKYDGVNEFVLSNLISGYRGGYTPEERKNIESKMVSGSLRGLISTNALELGIDMGKIDTTVLTGYPGTRASFWQQSGRSGRGDKTSDTFLILDNLSFDQYIAIDPDWLFESGSENAVIDMNNLFIQLAHIRAASAELPLTLDDIALFPDLGEIIPVLIDNKELKRENGKFVWHGNSFPAGDYSLRNIENERYVLTNELNDSVITEMNEIQAFREIHEGAIYMHDGQSFLVRKLDTTSKKVQAKPTDVNYYTDTLVETKVKKIMTHKSKKIGRSNCYFGDVNIHNSVQGFKKIQFHNHQNLGYQELRPKLITSFDSEGMWIEIPFNVWDLFVSLVPSKDEEREFDHSYASGLNFAIRSSAMMITMTTKEDIGSSILDDFLVGHPSQFVMIYDMFLGGLGFSEKAYDLVLKIIKNAEKMVSGCTCKDGCPACVGDYKLDKRVVLWGLQNIFEESPPPKDLKIPERPKETSVEKSFDLENLKDEWQKFTLFIKDKGEYLSRFLSSVDIVEVENNTLILNLSNDFYKTWLNEGENLGELTNILKDYVNVPLNFKIEVEIKAVEGKNNEEKILKRYKDLRR